LWKIKKNIDVAGLQYKNGKQDFPDIKPKARHQFMTVFMVVTVDDGSG
jgi:hypothetical protein